MMRFDFGREHYGKLILIGTAILIWLLIIVLLRTLGYHETWGLWKVPSWLPPFLDFRLIPGSAESFVHGYEPSVENPFDPTERIFNYPAFWRLFFYTGITQADTLWISVSMIVLFFISVFLFPEKLPVPGAIGTLLVLFSPASMLLYERGNVDLIVFVVCVMIVLASGYSAYLAAILIMFGGIMKLFPILGLSVLLRESKKKFLWLAAASTFVVTAYMIATWDSVQASWNLTMRGDGISYGTDVFVDRYADAITQMFSQWLTSSSYRPAVRSTDRWHWLYSRFWLLLFWRSGIHSSPKPLPSVILPRSAWAPPFISVHFYSETTGITAWLSSCSSCLNSWNGFVLRTRLTEELHG
jgi:hypothetical protein